MCWPIFYLHFGATCFVVVVYVSCLHNYTSPVYIFVHTDRETDTLHLRVPAPLSPTLPQLSSNSPKYTVGRSNVLCHRRTKAQTDLCCFFLPRLCFSTSSYAISTVDELYLLWEYMAIARTYTQILGNDFVAFQTEYVPGLLISNMFFLLLLFLLGPPSPRVDNSKSDK